MNQKYENIKVSKYQILLYSAVNSKNQNDVHLKLCQYKTYKIFPLLFFAKRYWILFSTDVVDPFINL